MNIAVISFTEQGRQQSVRIAAALESEPVRRYCFDPHSDADAEPFSNASALTERLFSACDALIFVCACGIAVRLIAPFVRSKITDPAVLVSDDSGTYLIPILSGHLGGANALADRLAAQTGALPVITTATDIHGKFSPDCFAAANHLLILDMNAAKQIAAAVLNSEKTGFCCDYPAEHLPPEVVHGTGTKTGIYIGTNMNHQPFPVTLQLIPKNIVLGIGCKRGTSAKTVAETVSHMLESGNIPAERVCAAASIDLKKNEAGLREYCAKHQIPLTFYSAEELMTVKGNFQCSDFVMQTTGANNVCERSAVLCSGGRLILQKFAENGVTAAAAEMPVSIDFERKMQ